MVSSTINHYSHSSLWMVIAVWGERGHSEDGESKCALARQLQSVDEVLAFHSGPLGCRCDAQRLTELRDAVDLAFAAQEIFSGSQRRTTNLESFLPRHHEREPARFENEDSISARWARHLEPRMRPRECNGVLRCFSQCKAEDSLRYTKCTRGAIRASSQAAEMSPGVTTRTATCNAFNNLLTSALSSRANFGKARKY